MGVMKFIDLFAGCGGMRLGLEQAGMKCVGFCEFDRFAVTSYRAIHDTEGEWYGRDIRETRGVTSPARTCGRSDSPVKISALQVKVPDLTEAEADYFTKSFASSAKKVKISPSGLSLKTLKGFCQLMAGEDFARYSIGWTKQGMMHDGNCLTAKTSVYRRAENVCLLSDVLEEVVDEKYFLSATMTAYLKRREEQTEDNHKPCVVEQWRQQ